MVTLPLASPGTATIIVAFSPTLISTTDTITTESYLLTEILEVILDPKNLLSPSYVAVTLYVPYAKSLTVNVTVLPTISFESILSPILIVMLPVAFAVTPTVIVALSPTLMLEINMDNDELNLIPASYKIAEVLNPLYLSSPS